jgi:ABC-type dipeptide/oligopeptide/nickel transport system permease component
MAKFIVRRFLLMLLTIFMVSVAVFAITTAAPGNVARNVLGIQITAEQEASFLAQNGLDKPMVQRFFYWLIGTDWKAARAVGFPLRQIRTEDGFQEWWAVNKDGALIQWRQEGENLFVRQRQPDGRVVEKPDDARWQIKDPAAEAARLEKYRAELSNNAQLTEADRQAIGQAVDEILRILRGKDQSQAALLAGLAKPEGDLEALRDPKAATKKQALQKAAATVAGNDSLLKAIAVYQALTGPDAGSLQLSERQFRAGQLSRAAAQLKDIDADSAAQLQQAYESLKAGDTGAAITALEGVVPTLKKITGNVGDLTDALQNGDYQAAANVLRDLGDPARNSFDPEQMAVLPALLQSLGNAIDDADPDVGAPFLQAVTRLKAGDVDEARQRFVQAAAVLTGVGQALARTDAAGQARVGRTFWGVDAQNHAVRWETGSGKEVWVFIQGTGWKATTGGPTEYIPLQRGLLRGDPGISLRTGRPVSDLLFLRLRNSLVLAGIAFVVVMPLALVLGILAGLQEGKPSDRFLSIGGMMFSVAPEFATGIFLILIFSFWLDLVPGATVFGEKAPWTRPDMLILPVLTLTLIELGYVLRITRASMVEVMRAPYIRTAYLKGLPPQRIVRNHAIRNALMAPITVIMLHVNWLLGGIVVVEVIFGYPGLGSYLLDSALFKDYNAIAAGAIVLVVVAISTQLIADVIYTFINPRIRYS